MASKSTIFFRNNPKSHANKLRIQAKINKKPSEVRRRVQLNKANRRSHAAGRSHVGDNKDQSHVSKSRMVLEDQVANRARKKSKFKSVTIKKK